MLVEQGFGAARRSIALSGSAYFDVRNANGAPFVVHAGTIETRVLGTQFVVRRYAQDRTTYVAVISGRVDAGSTAARVIVDAGTSARFTDSTATRADEGESLTGWTRGQLVFKDAPVHDMLAEVGRWYGYDFQLSDSLLSKRHVSVTFDVHDSAEMMTVLKGVLDVSMKVDGKVVRLTSRRMKPRERQQTWNEITSGKEQGR
jgi:ferric-dicitrate binding protein FerR (iron transport regulator)